MSDLDDTAIRRVLIREPNADPAQREAALRRTAQALDLLAQVLGGYPRRHAEVWSSEGWQKDARDLEIACEQLRKHATELRAIADASPPS